MKVEWVYQYKYKTRMEAAESIFECMETSITLEDSIMPENVIQRLLRKTVYKTISCFTCCPGLGCMSKYDNVQLLLGAALPRMAEKFFNEKQFKCVDFKIIGRGTKKFDAIHPRVNPVRGFYFIVCFIIRQ